MPLNLYTTAISSYLKSTALQMLISFKKQGKTDWSQFKNELVETFRPVDHERIIRTKLLNLRQLDSFDKYSNDFLFWSNQIPEMSDSDKLACFLQGLKPKTRTELVIKGVKNVNEAIILAGRIEHARNESISNTVAKVNYSNVRFKRDKSRVDVRNITCLKCKQKGHYATNCPSKTAINRPQNSFKNNNNMANVTCKICHKKGH